MFEEIDEYEEMEGVLNIRGPQKGEFEVNKFSRVDFRLGHCAEELGNNIIYDLKSLNSKQLDDVLDFDEIKEILNAKDTKLQKKTAIKIMKKYYRNLDTRTVGFNVNMDDELKTKVYQLEGIVKQKQDLIDDL